MKINKYISWSFNRNLDAGFCIGISPVWIHKHSGRYHYHLLIDLGFWYFELQIGDDVPKGEE